MAGSFLSMKTYIFHFVGLQSGLNASVSRQEREHQVESGLRYRLKTLNSSKVKMFIMNLLKCGLPEAKPLPESKLPHDPLQPCQRNY